MARRINFHSILLILFLGILLIPTGLASADIGPKPIVEFYFSYPGGRTLSAVSGKLLGCRDVDCLNPISLENNPYVYLECQAASCFGGSHFGSRYLRLQVLFSDGQARMSNTFTAPMMRNVYSVTVRDSDLFLTPNPILTNNNVWALYLSPLLMIVFIALIIAQRLSNSNLERHDPNIPLTYKSAQGSFIFAGVLGLSVLIGGLFLTWALPLTVVIEFGVATLFYRYYWPTLGSVWERKIDRYFFIEHGQYGRPSTMARVTSITTVNLITQPLLWGISLLFLRRSFASAVSIHIVLLEVGVWLVETVLLRITLGKRIRWGEALQLSFFMNITSYILGLFFMV